MNPQVGSRVFYYDGEGRESRGQVSALEVAADVSACYSTRSGQLLTCDQGKTKIARIRLEGSGSTVSLP